ncbi:hypothetical protein ACLKA7_017692 [Drosophila subpalustris]
MEEGRQQLVVGQQRRYRQECIGGLESRMFDILVDNNSRFTSSGIWWMICGVDVISIYSYGACVSFNVFLVDVRLKLREFIDNSSCIPRDDL